MTPTPVRNPIAAARELDFPLTARKKRPRKPPYVNDAMLSASSTTAWPVPMKTSAAPVRRIAQAKLTWRERRSLYSSVAARPRFVEA